MTRTNGGGGGLTANNNSNSKAPSSPSSQTVFNNNSSTATSSNKDVPNSSTTGGTSPDRSPKFRTSDSNRSSNTTSSPTTPSSPKRHCNNPKSGPSSSMSSPLSQPIQNSIRSGSPQSTRSPPMPKGKEERGGRNSNKENGLYPLGRRRRSLHSGNEERMEELKISDTRSTTPCKPRRQHGNLSPTSHSRTSPHTGGKEKQNNEMFMKAGEKTTTNCGSKTRGGSGRKDDRFHDNHHHHPHHRRLDEDDFRHHPRGRDLNCSTSDGRQRSNSRQGPNNTGMHQRGGLSAGPNHSRNLGNNNGGNGLENQRNLLNMPNTTTEISNPTINHQTQSNCTTNPQPFYRYTVDELRRLRYSPSANRKPTGLHSMIDRTKVIPPLALCPRATSRPQAGPSRTRRTPEPWGEGGPIMTRRDSGSSATKLRWDHVEETDTSANIHVNTEVKELVSTESSENHKSSTQTSIRQNGTQTPPISSNLTQRDTHDLKPKVSGTGTSLDLPNGQIQSIPIEVTTPPMPEATHKSTMGSADSAPFIPRQQQLEQQHFINQRTANVPVIPDRPDVLRSYPENRMAVEQSDWEKPLPYNHHNNPFGHGSSSPSRVPAIELQKDPAITSYGFNPQNQPRSRPLEMIGVNYLNQQPGIGGNWSDAMIQPRGQYELDNCMGPNGFQQLQSHLRANTAYNQLGGMDEDLWDAPVADANDIFTLGDIRAIRADQQHSSRAQSPKPRSATVASEYQAHTQQLSREVGQRPSSLPSQNSGGNIFTDAGLGGSKFFEDEDDGDGSNGGSTFIRDIFRGRNSTSQQSNPYSTDGNSASGRPSARIQSTQPSGTQTPNLAGPQAALEALLSQQLGQGGISNAQQQQQIRLKLEAWARSKGHQSLADLLAHQQRIAQQRLASQQQQHRVGVTGGRPSIGNPVRPGSVGLQPQMPNFPQPQMQPVPQTISSTAATNALLQALQRHNLSQEQAVGLARVIQQQPQLVGALLDNLRQQQQRHPQVQQPQQVSMPQRPPQIQPNQTSQQAALLQLVRQKLLAAQAAQAKSSNLPQQGMPQAQQQPPQTQPQNPVYANVAAALQQQLQQLGQQQSGNQTPATTAATNLAQKIAAARVAANGGGQLPSNKYMEQVLAMVQQAQERQQQQQVANQPLQSLQQQAINQQPFPQGPQQLQQRADLSQVQRLVQQLQMNQQGNPQLQQVLQRQLQQLLQQHSQAQPQQPINQSQLHQPQQQSQLHQPQQQSQMHQPQQQSQMHQPQQQSQMHQPQQQTQMHQPQQLHQPQQRPSQQPGSVNLQQLAQAARAIREQATSQQVAAARPSSLATQLASLPPTQQQQLAAHLLNLQRQQQMQREATTAANSTSMNPSATSINSSIPTGPQLEPNGLSTPMTAETSGGLSTVGNVPNVVVDSSEHKSLAVSTESTGGDLEIVPKELNVATSVAPFEPTSSSITGGHAGENTEVAVGSVLSCNTMTELSPAHDNNKNSLSSSQQSFPMPLPSLFPSTNNYSSTTATASDRPLPTEN